jgi:regulator of replication initiation timing
MVKDDKQALMSMIHAETNSTHALRQELQQVMERNHWLVVENCKLRAQMRTQSQRNV